MIEMASDIKPAVFYGKKKKNTPRNVEQKLINVSFCESLPNH
jgi:hypothetical protein